MLTNTMRSLRSILKCQDQPLLEKVETAIANLNQLDLSKKYTIAFSGGKDSHALLICFLLWKQLNNINTDNFTVKFADTRLETYQLYQLIENIETSVKDVKFERVLPQHSYWYYQFIYGYPVPDHFNRWCTKELKTQPMKKKKEISITGRHIGESLARDNRLLSNCSSGECGIDKIKKSIDPILHFRNCDVWDLIFYADDTILYEGVFNSLQSTYSQSEDEKGSLRMGCFMCPVVGEGTIYKDASRCKHGWNYRVLLEKLRKARRIQSPRKNKQGKKIKGAIYIVDRRTIWQELDKQTLLKLGYITKQEIKEIDYLIKKDSYPKTYSQEWINSEHKRLESETIYTDLPLFNYE